MFNRVYGPETIAAMSAALHSASQSLSTRSGSDEARRTLVDRAIGLLAGRVGFGLEEAAAHRASEIGAGTVGDLRGTAGQVCVSSSPIRSSVP